MSHLSYLKALKIETFNLIERIKTEKNNDDTAVENRQRLINLTKELQFQVLSHLSDDQELFNQLRDIIITWSTDSKVIYDSVLILDEELQTLLSDEKEKTQSQINRTYKSRQVLKSYNLNDVK